MLSRVPPSGAAPRKRRTPNRNAAGWLSLVFVFAFVIIQYALTGALGRPDGFGDRLDEPRPIATAPATADAEQALPQPDGVRFTSYRQADPTSLVLLAPGPFSRCPLLETASLIETDAAVTIRLVEVDTEGSSVCTPDGAELAVTLASELGERAVLDASPARPTLVRLAD